MRGGPILSDGAAPYPNELATDRATLWARYGRQGLLSGGGVTRNTVELAVDIAPFEAIVQTVVGSVPAAQGWYVWSDVTETVPLGAPDASVRIDAIVCAVRDPGTPRWVVVPGTPGSKVPPTDAEIEAHEDVAGATNGWFRLRDAQVSPGDATLKAGAVTGTAPWAGHVFVSVWHNGTTRNPGQTSQVVWANNVRVDGATIEGSRIVLPAGVYDVEFGVTYDGMTNDHCLAQVRRNSSASSTGGSAVVTTWAPNGDRAPANSTLARSKQVVVNDGDYLEFFIGAGGSATGTMNIFAGADECYLTMLRVGA